MERSYLHEEMGSVLIDLYGDQSDDVAVQLAWHFQQAGMTAEAVDHLHRAGVKALRLSANQEAIQHLERGLSLLSELPDDLERQRQELALQSAIGPALTAVKGFVAPEVEHSYTRAFELSQEIADAPEQFWTLSGLLGFYTVRRETEKAAELVPEMMRIAKSQSQEPLFLLLAHLFQASTHLFLGELEAADRHLRQTIDLDRPDRKRVETYLMGMDAGITARGMVALCAWLQGDLERAARQGAEALSMARSSGHRFSLAWVLHAMGLLHLFQRERAAVRERAEELLAFSREHGLYLETDAGFLLACVDSEEASAALSGLEQGLEAYRAARFNVWQTFYLAQLAELRLQRGELEQARKALDTASSLTAGERFWGADLLRLRGELSRAADRGGADTDAERHFREALELARDQGARSLELRAALSLGRLWQSRGRPGEAFQLLERACSGFPEGLESPDLDEARELLKALA